MCGAVGPQETVMKKQRKCFLVRCSAEQFAALVTRAAELGYGSASSRASRPGVARYLVDRGLSDAVLLTDDDRAQLRRLLWSVRDAAAVAERLADAMLVGDRVAAHDALAALGAIRRETAAIVAVIRSEVA
jgi:hypothetical protein